MSKLGGINLDFTSRKNYYSITIQKSDVGNIKNQVSPKWYYTTHISTLARNTHESAHESPLTLK